MAAAKPAPVETETVDKAAKFKEIAERRVVKVLDSISTLEGLANPQNYEYSNEQWEKIFATIVAGLNKVKAKVENPGVKSSNTFSL